MIGGKIKICNKKRLNFKPNNQLKSTKNIKMHTFKTKKDKHVTAVKSFHTTLVELVFREKGQTPVFVGQRMREERRDLVQSCGNKCKENLTSSFSNESHFTICSPSTNVHEERRMDGEEREGKNAAVFYVYLEDLKIQIRDRSLRRPSYSVQCKPGSYVEFIV